MDNRKLKLVEIEILRRKAVEAVIKHGITQKRASKLFGFSQTSMSKYITDYKHIGESTLTYQKRGVKPGTYSKLNEEQLCMVKDIIVNKTPDELSIGYALWTSKAVCEYIKKSFNINYAERSMRDVMSRLGFSSQKPIARAYKRNPEKIAAWLVSDYPAIKALASKEGARIYWGDEMGICSTDNRGRMYSPKGVTPVIKNAGTRFKCNMLAAISPQGFMNWMVFSDNFTAKQFTIFLGRLIRQIKQKVFLILDNHKVHHCKHVQSYISKHKDRIQLFFLPPYCPELNPEELVNQDAKANSNKYRSVRTAKDLERNLRSYLTKIQFNEGKIKNFFTKKEVLYASA
jgi:Transposase and inactivated derivatives